MFPVKVSYAISDKSSIKIYSTNNLTFTYPPSPLLTQLSQIPLDLFCYGQDQVPKNCKGKEFCTCVHIEHIPLGATTELILINQDENEHIFHLHGYSFYVVGHRQFNKIPTTEEATLLKRNFNNPIIKDTIRIGGKSLVAVRFQANNPGFWMLRDENSGGWTRGLDVVLQVGGAGEMPAVPDNFPTCGNYIGPDFFFA